MKKHSVESPFVPASPAQQWARRRNWTIVRLRGSYVSIPPDLMDKKLELLNSRMNYLRQEMISHIIMHHATYEESKKTRRKDSLEALGVMTLEKGLKNA